ncbi:MAG: hypothetical protein ACI3Z7_06335 [Candidatus Aphodosoma sp.]
MQSYENLLNAVYKIAENIAASTYPSIEPYQQPYSSAISMPVKEAGCSLHTTWPVTITTGDGSWLSAGKMLRLVSSKRYDLNRTEDHRGGGGN